MNPSGQSESSTEATKGLGLGHDDSGAGTTPVHHVSCTIHFPCLFLFLQIREMKTITSTS